MSVQRYEPDKSVNEYSAIDNVMEKDPDGDYVLYSDYEKLQEENEKLKARIEILNGFKNAIWRIANDNEYVVSEHLFSVFPNSIEKGE